MAARDLKVALSIDGAKQVAAAFAEVGNAAKSASSTISGAFNQAAVDNRLFVSLNRLKSGFSDFGGYLKNVGGAVADVEQKFGNFAARVGVLTAALTGAATAAGYFINNTVNTASELVDNANAAGVTAQKYTELEFILGQMGVSSEKFRTLMSKLPSVVQDNQDNLKKYNEEVAKNTQEYNDNNIKLQKHLIELQREGQTYNDTTKQLQKKASTIDQVTDKSLLLAKKLNDLGVNSKSSEQFLYQLLDAAKKLGNEQERVAFLSDILGPKIGPRLAEAANLGADGIKKLANELSKKGFFPSTQDLQTLENTGDSIRTFTKAIEYLRIKLVALAGPSISKVFEQLTNSIIDNENRLLKWTDEKIQEARKWIDAALAVFVGNVYSPNDKTRQLEELKAAFYNFAKDIYQAYLFIKDTFTKITDVFNYLFGTNFSPTFLAAILIIGRMTGAFTLLFSVLALGAAIFSPILAGITSTVVGFVGLRAAILGLITFLGSSVLGVALVALVYLIYQNFEKIKQAIYSFISGMGTFVSEFFRGWVILFLSSVSQLVSGWQSFLSLLGSLFTSATSGIVSIWNSLIQTLNSLWNSFTQFIGQALSNALTQALSGISSIGQLFNNYVIIPIQNGISSITNIFSNLGQSIYDALVNSLSNAASYISSIIDQITGWVSTAISYLNSLIQTAYAAASAVAGAGGGYASGGYVSGPGTSTSDSIPAWLSSGEFVMRAAAVRKYGVSLFQRLNGLNLSESIRDGFAMGGFVGIPAPALAPAIAGGRPINLTIGNDVFAMNASDDVAEKIIKYAAKRNIASTGRKPGWYGS